MELVHKRIRDAAAFEAFRTLVKSSGLPTDDLSFETSILIGYYDGPSLVGTGALERLGDYALLRSLSVKLGVRGKSLGSNITEALIDEARSQNVKAIYLLTETARDFFHKKGFKDVRRDAVPDAVKNSSEFSHVCPDTAACMFYEL